MAKSKQYKVIADVGVVGFNGVIHAPGDIIDGASVPTANLKVWLRFKQIEEVTGGSAAPSGDTDVNKKGKK